MNYSTPGLPVLHYLLESPPVREAIVLKRTPHFFFFLFVLLLPSPQNMRENKITKALAFWLEDRKDLKDTGKTVEKEELRKPSL